MKLITINVEDEEHTAIKLAATKAGLSIKNYLLRNTVTSKDVADISLAGRVKLYDKIKPAEPFVGIELELVPPVAKNLPRESDGKLCKHSKPPTFCKFAKPGKPCK